MARRWIVRELLEETASFRITEDIMSNKAKPTRRRDGMLQCRPKSGSDQRWYSPDRDLTVLFPRLIRQTFVTLSGDLDSAVTEVWSKLGVSNEEMTLMVKTFAGIVKCVLMRGEDLEQALEKSGFCAHRAQAIIGMVFLRLITEQFVSCYGQTLHKGEFDPNHRDLKDCLKLLDRFAENGLDEQKE